MALWGMVNRGTLDRSLRGLVTTINDLWSRDEKATWSLKWNLLGSVQDKPVEVRKDKERNVAIKTETNRF